MRINKKIIIRFIGILFIAFSIILILVNYRRSQIIECVFPEGSTIANVNVSGLSKNQAETQIQVVYEQPFEIQINGIFLELVNDQLGLVIHYDEMVDSFSCVQENTFDQFWNFIWDKTHIEPVIQDLSYALDEKILINTINQLIKPMVEKPAEPARPISGTTRYQLGENGFSINQEKMIADIKQEIVKQERSTIVVELIEIPAAIPSLDLIKAQVKEIIIDSQFNGVVEIYAAPMKNEEEFQLLMWYGDEKEPGVAFTAASTMKIPILISTFWRNELPLSDMMNGWIEFMIVHSENDPADRLMEQVDFVRGPLLVTSDLQSLGFENTFIGGYFYLGAPLLNLYQTTANQRTDAFIGPDVYNQTTPEEIGRLLKMIYQCSVEESADLIQKTDGLISMEECNQIIDVLARNKMGALIESGLPEGTRIAHKHGWSQERDGLVHSFSDVAIVYGPENDFVLTIFLYSEDQLLFDRANPLIARISQSIYNGLNPNYQIAWPFSEN